MRTLALSLALVACTKTNPQPTSTPEQAPEPVAIAVDAGAALLSVGKRPAVEVPREDLPLPQTLELAQNDKRIAYRANGGTRIAYVVGEQVIWGRKLPGTTPLDWSNIPTFASALKELYAQGQQERMIEALKQSEGAEKFGDAMATLADVQDHGEWWRAYQTMDASAKSRVLQRLTPEISGKSAPTTALHRAVRAVDLSAHGATLVLRLEQLMKARASDAQFDAPIAVMMRAAMKDHAKEVAVLACNALAPDVANTSLASTLALAIVHAKHECANLRLVLEQDPCVPDVRCTDAGPVQATDKSEQAEAVCTAADATKAVDRELQRSAEDVLIKGEPKAALFALAMLPPPPPFIAAHERRLYRIAQSDKPECSTELKEGTACHCNVAALRDAACRAGAVTSFSSGACAFTLNSSAKTLSSVVATRTARSQ